jgi:hypothetical protein
VFGGKDFDQAKDAEGLGAKFSIHNSQSSRNVEIQISKLKLFQIKSKAEN